MANRELREWLGLTLADLIVYLGTAAIVAMFVVKDRTRLACRQTLTDLLGEFLRRVARKVANSFGRLFAMH